MSIAVKKGVRYIGGGSRFRVFMSLETIKGWLEGQGFSDVVVIDRTEVKKGDEPFVIIVNGAPYNPRRSPGGYSDDWNTLAMGTATADRSVDPPADPAWVDVLRVKPGTPKETPAPAPLEAPSPQGRGSNAGLVVAGVVTVGVGLLAGFAGWAWDRWRK